MRTLNLMILTCIAAALHPPVASAQTCLGLPSFTNGSVHVNLAGDFLEDATGYAAGIGAGRPNNLFANLGGGQVQFDATVDGPEGKSTYGFLEFGVQIPVGRAQLCPIAGGSLGAGPDDESIGQKVTSRTATGGLAFGVPIGGGRFTVIPNAGVLYQYLSQKVEATDTDATTDTYGSTVANVGLALVFGDRVSLQPLAHIPLSGDGDDKTSFGIFASVSFGWRAQ